MILRAFSRSNIVVTVAVLLAQAEGISIPGSARGDYSLDFFRWDLRLVADHTEISAKGRVLRLAVLCRPKWHCEHGVMAHVDETLG